MKRFLSVALAVGLFTGAHALAAEPAKKPAEAAKPAEAKPADAKPADAKPADAKPAAETTLSGTIQCAKCSLKIADSCNTVITVKEGGKDVMYWFDAESDKKEHDPFCKSKKTGSVTGSVTEKDGKKWLKVSKVDLKK